MRRCGFYLLLLGSLFFTLATTGLAQAAKSDSQNPPPIPPEEGRKQARELLENLLKLKPSENATQTLLLKITDREDLEKQVPVIFSIVITPTNFLNVYEAVGRQGKGARLTIVHHPDTPDSANEYLLSQPTETPPRKLSPAELMTPFAGADFWIADLGLEFLHWPDQRIVKKQMRKNLFCDVLESTNPQMSAGGYSKVVSWVAANRPDDVVIVHADAYDSKGKLLKQFDPKKVRKVNGAWELAEMEIRNRLTRSTTRIEFDTAASQ